MLVAGLLPVSTASRGLVIFCYSRKGQGKKGQGKTPKKADQPEEIKGIEKKTEETPAPPPRITDAGPHSLKSKLRYVKAIQAQKLSDAQDGSSKAYRKKVPKKPLAQVGAAAIRPKRILRPELNKSRQEKAKRPKTEEELAKERAIARNRKIAGLYHRKCAKGAQAALIVDGYNVMLQWVEEPAQKHLKAVIGSSFDAVRDAFIREVSAYSAKDLKVLVAFDAIGNLASPSIARDIFAGIEIVFVGCSEADAFISQEAMNLRKLGCPYVLVASNDHDVSEACWADEIFPMSSLQLLAEIRKEKKEYMRLQEEKALQASGQDLGARMMAASPQLYMQLERMRRGQQQKQ